MRTLKSLLLAGGSLLGMAGCLPDFSPDPINSDSDGLPSTDAGSSSDAGDASVKKDSSAPTDAKVTPTEDASEPVDEPDTGVVVAPTDCDLTGKWAITEHFAMSGLGAKQTVWNWFYAEIQQSGTDISYKKSISCGANVVGIGIEVNMDDELAWPAYAMKPAYEGRKGTAVKTADGCMVSIEKAAVVRGATVEAYRDFNVPLPKADTFPVAMGGTPGSEDWDEDGHPGVTLDITGFVAGQLYAVMRNITAYSGVVEEGASLMKFALDWSQTRATLGYTNVLLTADAAKDSDASKSIVEFGKLTDEQATGSNEEICATVRMLAPTLTPNASKIQ